MDFPNDSNEDSLKSFEMLYRNVRDSEEMEDMVSDKCSYEQMFKIASSKQTFTQKSYKVLLKTSPSFMSIYHSGSGHLETDNSTIGIRKIFSMLQNDIFEKIENNQINWHKDFNDYWTSSKAIEPKKLSKWIAEINRKDTLDNIAKLMSEGISVFYYKLQMGTMAMNREIQTKMALAKDFISKAKDFPILFSGLPHIGPHFPQTGCFAGGVRSFELALSDIIEITTNRALSMSGSKTLIYVNFISLFNSVQIGHEISINSIRLGVIKILEKSIKCEVIQPGLIYSETRVQFEDETALDDVTIEEVQDITFAVEIGSTVIVVDRPERRQDFDKFLNILKEFNSKNMRLLCYVKETDITEEESAFICSNFDGIVIESINSETVSIHLSQENLMKKIFKNKKPIILWRPVHKGCFINENKVIENRKAYYFYTDLYLLKRTEHEIISNNTYTDFIKNISEFALKSLEEPFEDKSQTGSDTMARSIVQASYKINASAIIVCSETGRMATKISHFRPACPIIVLIKNKNGTAFLQLHHNIWIALYEESPKFKEASAEDRLDRRLLYGILYGIITNLVQISDFVIFCNKSKPNIGYTDKMTIVKVDAESLASIIRH